MIFLAVAGFWAAFERIKSAKIAIQTAAIDDAIAKQINPFKYIHLLE